MTIKRTRESLESHKFRDGKDGNPVVAILNEGGLAIPYNNGGSVAYPNGTTEIYTFTNDAITVMTITLTYTAASKEKLSTWAVS